MPAGCRLEVITVQEEVEETKVICHTFVKLLIMMILLFMLIILTMDIVRTLAHRSRKSSARQSSVRLAPSNSRKIAEMSPGHSLLSSSWIL